MLGKSILKGQGCFSGFPVIRKSKQSCWFPPSFQWKPPPPPRGPTLLPQTCSVHTRPPQSYPSIKFVNKRSWDLFLFSFVFIKLWTFFFPFWSSARTHTCFLRPLQTRRSILFLLFLSKSSNGPVLGFRALKGCLQIFMGVAGELSTLFSSISWQSALLPSGHDNRVSYFDCLIIQIHISGARFISRSCSRRRWNDSWAPFPSPPVPGLWTHDSAKGPSQQDTAAFPKPLLQHPRAGAHWIKTGNFKNWLPLLRVSPSCPQLSSAMGDQPIAWLRYLSNFPNTSELEEKLKVTANCLDPAHDPDLTS